MARVAARPAGAAAIPRRPDGAEGEAPLWGELLWPLDWLNLRLSPVYYGLGVPQGDGGAVVLVPGFLGTDLYLMELYLWLRRVGYRPYMSGIAINADCPDRLVERLLLTMERAHRESGGAVRLIGHSLGGLIARGACLRRPELASQLIFLGTPIRTLHAHPLVLSMVALLRLAMRFGGPDGQGRCLSGSCGCSFAKALHLRLPDSIRHCAIYSRGDGVVGWRDAREADPRLNHEVAGTHVGLVCNAAAYRLLGQLLPKGKA